MKLGINLGSPGSTLRHGLALVAKLGVTGVQLDAAGELDPRKLSQTGQRELKNILKSHGVELSALGCPLRHSLDHDVDQQPRIEHVMNVMKLAFDLGPRIVVVSAGPIPPADSPNRMRMVEAIGALARHGERIGATLALETGHESGETLAEFLRPFESVGVNYDPANLLLHGHDPIVNIAPLKNRIVHTHARDARKSGADRLAAEVPIGYGDIDWMSVLANLAGFEYRGRIVVERAGGLARWDDIAAGVQFLRRLI